MKFRKIGTKMLIILLTVSLFSMILLSIVSYTSSKAIIGNQIQQNMNAELEAQVNNILLKTEKISTIAAQIARNVESNYSTTTLAQYEDMLGKVIFESDLAFGGGIWFEPYVYDKQQKYMGPYVYKENDSPVVTYDYSNEEYDYFSYDWYMNAINSKEPVFSELYYDPTLNTTMATCAVPMYGRNETFLGVITVDMEISSIQDMINKVTIGENGKLTLLTKDGLYISNEDASKVMTANMKDEANKSMASMGQEMLRKDNGTGEFYKDSIVYKTYYSKVGDLGWRIMIQMPESEINQPLDALLFKLISICIAALLLLIAVIILQVRSLTKNIKVVNRFALSLAGGDFTVSGVNMKSQDEFGQMGQALNKMLLNNKAVIQTIMEGSKDIRKASTQLEDITENLKDNFNNIDTAIKGINEDIISSSAATQEVNASVEEVNAFINILTQETGNSHNMAFAIKDRASEVQKRSTTSFDKAMQLSEENEKQLGWSMEEAKIVESIGIMATTISQMAEQVNLLSLNASIEAARAGEQGKGFAVVAKEIGKLAFQTTSTVNEITQTTDKVQIAFNNLLANARQMLTFVQEIVTPDYKAFVEMGDQYELDANDIQVTATKISDMTNNIERIIGEVVEAIQGIAADTERTAAGSSDILSSMQEASVIMDNIGKAVSKEKEMSNELDHMVNKFKLE